MILGLFDDPLRAARIISTARVELVFTWLAFHLAVFFQTSAMVETGP